MIYLGNNCISTRMYEKLNIQFNNPFCWGRFTYTDFKKIIMEWNDINFNIIDISKLNDSHLIVDNKIDFYYQHYKYDEKYNIPTKKDIDIYYNKIYSYIFDKYFERLKRMDKQDSITYILHQQQLSDKYQISNEDCLDFIQMQTNQQKILVTYDKTLLAYNKYRTNIIFADENKTTGEIANMIIKDIYKR